MSDFFGKVKDGFNKSVATMSTGSKTMIEKTKINSCIKTLEEEKKQLSEILGNKIYSFCVQNSDADIPRTEADSICGEIAKREEQIADLHNKLQQLENEMNQVMGTSSVSSGPIRCRCGHVNVPGAKFCASCGNKLF